MGVWGWIAVALIGVTVWFAVAVVVGLGVGRTVKLRDRPHRPEGRR